MYSARITRHNPTAFILLIDHSGSMEEKMQFGKTSTTKAEVVAIVTNMLIAELINRCRKDDGIVDYFDIAAVGYSGEKAELLLSPSYTFVKPSRLERRNCRKKLITQERVYPDGQTRISSNEVKYWVEPKADGNTPMRSALDTALNLLTRWCSNPANKDSYPPTVFNITDGEATDGDNDMLCSLANEIKATGTSDGRTLLININISSTSSDKTVIFPGSKDDLPGCRYTNLLYDMSSDMPRQYTEMIQDIKEGSLPPYRGMSLNTSAGSLISMMNIGSISIGRLI
ncbi:MAG: VWA domain-containing protein [Rikenellaceae bacterium]|nr:VWA domain-containing protein [Rikenellaceae bacterium]